MSLFQKLGGARASERESEREKKRNQGRGGEVNRQREREREREELVSTFPEREIRRRRLRRNR